MCSRIVSKRTWLALAVAFGFATLVSQTRAEVLAPDFSGKLFVAYDGTQVATANAADRVSSWTDQAGSHNAVQATAANQPYLVTENTGNGDHPVLDFRGTGTSGIEQYLTTSAWTGLSQTTIFLVARRDVGDSNSYLIDGIDSSHRNSISLFGTNKHEALYAGGGVVYGPEATFGEFAITTAVFNGANSAIRVNGTKVTGNPGSNDLTGLTIGAWNAHAYCLNGQIAEALVYNGALTSTEIGQVESYLSNKYIVPEPGSMVLLGACLPGAWAYAWRKRRW